MTEKKKVQIEYPKVTPKIEVDNPRPLPFSLRNQAIIDVMSLLGISNEELSALPIQHFLKSEKSDQKAISAYKRHLSRRNDLIKLILETRKGIESKGEPKLAAEVVYQRHLAEVEDQSLKTKEEIEKATIRRIALNQLRLAYKIQRGEEKVAKQSLLSTNHEEKLSQTLSEAQENAEKREFAAKERGNLENCLFIGKTKSKPNDLEVEKRFMFLTEQKKQKLSESAKVTSEKIGEAQQRQVNQLSNTINHRTQRLHRNDEVLMSIPEKRQKRDEKLKEKADKRETITKDVNKRNVDFTKQKINKVQNLLDTEQQNFQKVMSLNQTQVSEKLEKEAEILKKRNEAAEKIFEQQKTDLLNYKIHLNKRDSTIQQNKDSLENGQMQRLQTAKLELEDKAAQIRRAQKARDCQTAFALRQKVSRSMSGIKDYQKQRAKSQLAKAKAEETFIEKKNIATCLLPDVVGLSDRQKAQTIMASLGLSEEEATEMVEIAKARPNIH